MENTEQLIKKVFAKNGIVLGLLLSGLSIFSFYFITSINSSPIMFVVGPLIFSFVIPLALLVVFCFSGRKKIGGYWNFKQATTGIFIMIFMAYIIQTIGRDLIFANLIEPHMTDKTEKAFLNASALIRKQPGANQKQLDQNEADVKKHFDEQKHVTIISKLQEIATTIIFIFMLALIFAILFKRETVYISTT